MTSSRCGGGRDAAGDDGGAGARGCGAVGDGRGRRGGAGPEPSRARRPRGGPGRSPARRPGLPRGGGRPWGSPKIELSRCGPSSVPDASCRCSGACVPGRPAGQAAVGAGDGGLDPLAGRYPGGAFAVQRGLEDEHGRRLVDHRTLPASGAPRLSRSCRCAVHRGQPLVDEPHRHRRDTQPRARRVRRGPAPPPGPRRRTATAAARRRPRRPRARATSPRSGAWSAPPPGRARSVSTGVASSPRGSLAASPTRTVPTSTPSRTPRAAPARSARP